MKVVALIAPMLLSLPLFVGCGGDGRDATASSASSGDAGEQPARPIEWKPLPVEGAPSPRFLHTAVWTGSKMIIWGGNTDGAPSMTATGAVYDPTSGTWSPTSTNGAPTARYLHTAVWTGSKMIVWGGYSEGGLATGGGVYDPATDTWSAMATAGEPAPRLTHTAIWAGNVMIVWGGNANSKILNSGGLYDPASNAWTAVSSSGTPSARFSHSAVFTGSRMIVWGGYNLFDWSNSGASLDPVGGGGGKWIGPTASVSSLTPREGHTGVWSGSAMLIWGGWTGGPYEDTGALFNPASGAEGSWTAMAAEGAPSPRTDHIGLWAGDELIIWGGCGEDACKAVYADGARFTPSKDGGTWSHVGEQAGLSPRRGAAGVVTGSGIIIWGGRDAENEKLGTGAESVL